MNRLSKNHFYIIVCAVCAVALVLGAAAGIGGTLGVFGGGGTKGRTVIVDAGHGNMDIGGAAASGLLEKDVNLDIAHRLANLLTLDGYNVIMTRVDDAPADGGDVFIKKSDIKSRIALANAHPEALFVSIHTNIFTDGKYWGAQMFYSDGTEKLARRTQENFRQYLQGENDRVAKPIPSTVYLFKNINNPALLAECGFLSNAAEAEKLASEDYRARIALLLFCSIDECYK